MKKIIRTLATASASFLVVFAVASCSQSKSGQKDGADTKVIKNVVVKAAELKEVEQTETFTGTVEGFNTNNISPQTASRIERIYVEVGDHVIKGQRLAQMDGSNLTQARLQMENNKDEFERTRQLYEVGGASKSEYDQKRTAYEVSEASYNNLVTNTYLVSPITGIVTARNYDAGDMYLGSNPLFTVEQIRPVKIMVNAPENLFGKIKKNDLVDITLDTYGNEVFKGKVYLVYPSLDAATRSFPVQVTIDNTNERVRPGMFARVKFTFDVQRNIVVPDVSIIKQTGSGQRYVFVVEDDKAVIKFVELGTVIGTEYEIKSGLQEGEMVVVEGQNNLNNGQQVSARIGEPASFTPDEKGVF